MSSGLNAKLLDFLFDTINRILYMFGYRIISKKTWDIVKEELPTKLEDWEDIYNEDIL